MTKKKISSMIIGLSLIVLTNCSPANVDYVKERAAEKWEKQGFIVLDYEGYMWGKHIFPTYGGAYVWYRLRKIPDNGITYSGAIQRWEKELHVYGPTAVEAIKP